MDERTGAFDEANETLALRITSRRVVLGTLALVTTFAATVGLDRLGVSLPVFREVIAVVLLTVVPGYLLVRIIGLTPRYRVETLLYTVGLSVAALMAIGVIANFTLRAVGVARPLTELPLLGTITVAVLVLLTGYARTVDEDWTLVIPRRDLQSPIVLGLALLPFLGVYGALLLTRFAENRLLLLLYAAVAIVPILVLRDRLPRRLLPYALWMIALALLLQNTLTGQYLAWGDQPKEAALALDVMRTGYWLPANAPAFGSKFAMLRIVLLHPIYALLTDLELVWVFKLVHPLLFSLTPVALYQAYRRFLDERAAFLAAFFYLSLFSFFIVLSRNTRTATAILFLAFVALLVADETLAPVRRKLLAAVFVASIVVSHYGVSYMVLFALVAALVATGLGRSFVTRWQAVGRRFTTMSFVGFSIATTFAWYLYASPRSKTFNMVVGFGRSFVHRFYTEFLTAPGSASATTRYVTTDFTSATLNFIKTYNLVLGAIIGLGLAVTVYRVARDRDVPFSPEYLAYAVVFFGVFGVTFLPVERFNTARTYPTTLVFFAPFLVVGVGELYDRIRTRIPANLRSDSPGVAARRLAALAVIAYFLLNVGFVSATVTHEYSTNALVEKDRIMDEGAPVEQTYFYKQYPTAYGVASTDWLRTHGTANATVYRSAWPGGMQGAIGHQTVADPPRNPGFQQRPITRDGLNGTLGEGYLYLNAYSVIGGTIKLPSGHFEFQYVRTDEARTAWGNKSRVYTNGGSQVYR